MAAPMKPCKPLIHLVLLGLTISIVSANQCFMFFFLSFCCCFSCILWCNSTIIAAMYELTMDTEISPGSCPAGGWNSRNVNELKCSYFVWTNVLYSMLLSKIMKQWWNVGNKLILVIGSHCDFEWGNLYTFKHSHKLKQELGCGSEWAVNMQ